MPTTYGDCQISLEVKNYRCFADSSPARVTLKPGFTAFVGPNNSGKSALFRMLHELRPVFKGLSGPKTMLNVISNRNHLLPDGLLPDLGNAYSSHSPRDLSLTVTMDGPTSSLDQSQGDPLKSVTLHCMRATKTARVEFPRDLGTLKAVPSGAFSSSSGRPLLLDMICAAFEVLASAFYFGPFRNASPMNPDIRQYDCQVARSFIGQWMAHKMGNDHQARESLWSTERALAAVFGFEFLDITGSPDSTVLRVLADGKSCDLHDLGSGLSEFVVILGNLATAQPSLVLIDEPELHLHPRLQVELLRLIGERASYGVAFSTHQVGLARSFADTVYSFRRNRDGRCEVSPFQGTPSMAEFMGEMGYSQLAASGAKSVLLVEGPKDVRVAQQWLRILGKDPDIVVLPLSGTSLINAEAEEHLLEVKKLAGTVSALIDSERKKEGQSLAAGRGAFVEACKRTGVAVHVTVLRALENYFPSESVQRCFGDNYSALEPYQLLKDAAQAWHKSDNWRIAGEMSRKHLLDTDVGQFLAAL